MSYRELRNFTETLRALSYPRFVSIENFRTPNFKLVAEIMEWLLKRYDPDNDLAMVIDSEQDRVIFIKQACLFLLQKARIKVNPKKLYQADGYAVQELLKVTSVLYNAMQQNQTIDDINNDTKESISAITSSINSKMTELRLSRQLAAEIPEKGAGLYDLLAKEVDLREQRSIALARPLELSDVERSLKKSIKAVEEEIKQTVGNLDNVASDETTLDSKIEKKKTELERQQKRLAQLQSVRPAYMDEYEQLEGELKQLYSVYVQKYRNQTYLEHVQTEYDKAEHERTMEAEISLRKLAERTRDEERARILETETIEAANIGPQDMSDDNHKSTRVYGNITGAGLSDDDDDDDDDNKRDDDSLLSNDDDDEIVGQMNARKGMDQMGDDDGLSELSDDDMPIQGDDVRREEGQPTQSQSDSDDF